VVKRKYRDFYRGEQLIKIVDEAPWVSNIAGKHTVEIGGFGVAPGGKRVVMIATLDNLLKGAATQAMQNVNIALGLFEFAGITHD
jgi:N-acetyl-gamma-glutamyl-phosphate reductase